MSFLLDTKVESEWVRPQPDRNVIAWLAEVDEDRVFISVISFASGSRDVTGRAPPRAAGHMAR